MATPGFLSKRVKKKPQSGLTSDRYEFLGLDQAEPDLGDPLVGPSSIGANPVPLSGSQYVLVASGENTGKRYWTPSANLSTGLIPGSFTVYNNNVQVGLANSFNKFNFVGSGVTVDQVGFAASNQTGIATVRITVTDLTAPGDLNTIPYHSNSGFLDGAPDFVYNGGYVGIGTTNPTSKLHIVGDVKSSGIVTASSFVGNLSGTATTATNLADAANITTGTISSSRLSGSYGISITGTATTATNLSNAANITTGTISSSRLSGSYGISITGTATTANNLSNAANITTGTISSSRLSGSYGISITGTATTANNVSNNININTSGIITATTFYGNLIGSISTTGQSFETIVVSGISSFTNGPVFIGSGTSTGTADQKLQVTGGAYVSGNLGVGTTNPQTKLQVGGVIGFNDTNIRIGDKTIGANLTSGTENIFIGAGAGSSNTSGNQNSFFGSSAGYNNTTGNRNNFLGFLAGLYNTDGSNNNFIGPFAGFYNKTGQYNNFFGDSAGYYNTDGGHNNFFGKYAGIYNQTGNYNIFFGERTGISTSASDKIIFGRGNGSNYFDSPETTKDTQFAVGVRTDANPSKYWLVGNENFNIGIGTTNPQTKLQVETYGIKTGVGTFVASSGVSTTIDSFSVSSTDFKTAEYTVHIGYGTYIQAQKVLLMQNQSTAYTEEYAVMYNNSLIVSIGATISGGNCIIQATPQTGVSGLTTYRFVRNTLL